jgi:signal transduction histidine kinase
MSESLENPERLLALIVFEYLSNAFVAIHEADHAVTAAYLSVPFLDVTARRNNLDSRWHLLVGSNLVRNRIGELQKQASEIATDIQTLSHDLHSAKLEHLGPVGAMRTLCQELGEQTKVKIEFKTQDLPSPLPPEISLCLFRVLQEALRNAVRHSGAPQVEVELRGTPDEIHLAVSDRGIGFDSRTARGSRGLGLVSMEERLKLLKGSISIESQPNRGTTIHARLPLS